MKVLLARISCINLFFLWQIKVSDTTVLESIGSEKDASNANIAVFLVRLLDSLTLWEKELIDISVEVSHTRSGHRVRIPVYVKLIGQKPDAACK